jgi:hypothetical protein
VKVARQEKLTPEQELNLRSILAAIQSSGGKPVGIQPKQGLTKKEMEEFLHTTEYIRKQLGLPRGAIVVIDPDEDLADLGCVM